MHISAYEAAWFLPFVLPLCFYTCLTDLREMRITNRTVSLLALVFLLMGPFLMPLDQYGWRVVQLLIVLAAGIVLNAAGAMGAGDAKFIAAAAPFVAFADLRLILAILAASLLGAFVAHRIAKHSPLRRLAPEWKSWSSGKRFPMGLALGATLAIYLILGALYGR